MSERLILSEAVRTAVATGEPVVALETSVLAHGLPVPRNVEAIETMSGAIRERGVEPAWIAVLEGTLRVGISRDELVRLATEGIAAKVTRRDLPMALAGGRPGATTVSAMLWAAHRAGIEVMATGGIGGVHPGSGDVSADLRELARTPGTLVCSGPKSIVDPHATMERLEELGVSVLGYRCTRLPFFVVRETDIQLEHLAQSPADVAVASQVRRDLGIHSTMLVCNPVPEDAALPATDVAAAVAECETRAGREGVSGKSLTPFLLSCLAMRTEGATVSANLALLTSNAALGAEIATALAP
jgi:pseudouridine-5'-phosphate glycosidase